MSVTHLDLGLRVDEVELIVTLPTRLPIYSIKLVDITQKAGILDVALAIDNIKEFGLMAIQNVVPTTLIQR